MLNVEDGELLLFCHKQYLIKRHFSHTQLC